jgi:hypothetical protein
MDRFGDNSPGFKASADATVVMRFPDGTLTWTGGVLTGDPPSIATVFESVQAPAYGSPQPDGPSIDLSTWREDPWAFITRAKEVFSGERPAITTTGVPALKLIPPESALNDAPLDA